MSLRCIGPKCISYFRSENRDAVSGCETEGGTISATRNGPPAMTFVVAFDGTPLSEGALARAGELADGEEIVAVAVIPGDATYARNRGWVDAESEFDPERVADRLERQAEETAPEASFRSEFVDAYSGAYTISRRLGKVIRDLNPTIVFLGSENAGRIVAPVSSVGSKVAGSLNYDVHIVRTVD